jgi:hypothetical protein
MVPLRNLPGRQADFLDLFNIAAGAATWRQVALDDAMTSASKRTRLYEMPSDPRVRATVRAFWRDLLRDRLEAYEAGGAAFATDAQYERDVMGLRATMNTNFPGVFLQRRLKSFDSGFRVAHAQKSLSLVLKHGWCNGVVEMPPQCVVDRRVLKVAGATQVERRWTDVNTWDEHLTKIDILAAAARRHADWPLTMAEWELWAFGRR